MRRTAEMVRLLDADPDLGALLNAARREQAERELVVRTQRLPAGPWDVSHLAGAAAEPLGLLILSGVLARELLIADDVSTELLGPGDLVRPWQPPGRTTLLPVDAVWSVLSPLTVAVLDRRFAAEMARYPEITAALLDRLSERSLRLATTQAISQLTRVDRRLTAQLWHLAERWGPRGGRRRDRPLALTHRVLGQLVGARRPTVSNALSELAERGELVRRRDGAWQLCGDPPDAHSLVRHRSADRAPQRAPNPLRPARPIAASAPTQTPASRSPRSTDEAAVLDRHAEPDVRPAGARPEMPKPLSCNGCVRRCHAVLALRIDIRGVDERPLALDE